MFVQFKFVTLLITYYCFYVISVIAHQSYSEFYFIFFCDLQTFEDFWKKCEFELCIAELEARENAAVQKAAKEKSVKEQQTKDAAKLLEQEVAGYYLSLLIFT